MRGRFFLDTNVLVYALDSNDDVNRPIAQRLVADAVRSQRGVISYQVVQELVHVALRKMLPPLTPDDVRKYMDSGLWRLQRIESSETLMLSALDIYERYRFAWYDSLIVAAAIAAECELLYTEDLQHGQRIGPLEVRNPFPRDKRLRSK